MEPTVTILLEEYNRLKKSYDEQNEPKVYPHSKVYSFRHDWLRGHFNDHTLIYMSESEAVIELSKYIEKLQNEVNDKEKHTQKLIDAIDTSVELFGFKIVNKKALK